MNFEEVKHHVVTIIGSQTFWIGENADIEVVVTLYKFDDKHYLKAKLYGVKLIEAVVYNGSINDNSEILAAMENLINDNEEYIFNLVSSGGE